MNEQYNPYSGGKPASYNTLNEFLESLAASLVHSRRRRKELEGC